MKCFAFRFLTGLAMLTCSALATAQTSWNTVVNNGDIMPGTSVLFNSYNQPSINNLGTVVFRARSKGETGTQPVHGIYTRNMAKSSALVRIFDKTSPVPSPNNNNATFIEFPSFPRIDQASNNLVTRGTSQPVLTYNTPDGKTKAGTSGVYTFTGKKSYTAAAQLGNVSGYEYFQVPGATTGTKFDQFPGAPSITGNLVVFKGNYTENNLSLTGIYYRDFSSKGGKSPVVKIADHNTAIPGTSATSSIYFGATAPPSAALGKVVFTGWDNEETPTYGGIYIAPLSPSATITPIVSIGTSALVGGSTVTFKNFGESLSFDGRYIAFWASWGDDTRTIRLNCPTDGNKDLIAYCNQEYPHGYNATVPVYQGIFLYDTQTSTLTTLAESPTDYRDFLYWVFSGKPPATGSSESTDGEPARWRASSFVAAYNGQVVFKAQTANSDGIYDVEGADPAPVTTLLQTGTPGTLVDPKAPAGSVVISLGIERDGYRNGVLAITAGMLDAATSESWAGIYTRNLP